MVSYLFWNLCIRSTIVTEKVMIDFNQGETGRGAHLFIVYLQLLAGTPGIAWVTRGAKIISWAVPDDGVV